MPSYKRPKMCRLKTSITKSGVIKSNCIADKNALTMDPECKHSSSGRCVLNRVMMPKPPAIKRKSSKKKKTKKQPIYVTLPSYGQPYGQSYSNAPQVAYILPSQPVRQMPQVAQQLRQIKMVPYRSSQVSDVQRYTVRRPINKLPSYNELMTLTPNIRY
jgi:hypothetical protein